MTRSTWNGMATLCFIVGVSLGVIPLVQWFAFERASGMISTIFGSPSAPWTWGIPAIVLSAAAIGVLLFGVLSDKADR